MTNLFLKYVILTLVNWLVLLCEYISYLCASVH